jgi:aryl-alcohol dehydrogenase-like predicted oxidoreductase
LEYRNLGKDGPSVSAIGFGCREMGGQHDRGTDDSEVTRTVHRGIDLGVTLYDTAPNYGFGGSETVLGKALGARRKDAILVSTTCG